MQDEYLVQTVIKTDHQIRARDYITVRLNDLSGVFQS